MERSGDYSDGCRRLRELLPPQSTTEERLGPALEFLNEVKVRLHGKPGNYRTFCSVVENLTDSPIRLIASGQDLLQPEELPWIFWKILDGQEDLIEKFNSYLPENLRVSTVKAATATEAVAVEPATAEARVLTAATAMADLAVKTSSACQRLQPCSGLDLDKLFDQVSEVQNEQFLHRCLPVAAGAEMPPQPAIPLFLSGGGLARMGGETYNRMNNNNIQKAARVVVEVDGKLKDKLRCEKSRFLGLIQKRKRELSSFSESHQQLLPSFYLYSSGKRSSVAAETVQCSPNVTKEVEKRPRPRPRPRPDEAELKFRRRRRFSASTPEKEKFKAAAVPQGPPTVEAEVIRRRPGGGQQIEKSLPVRVEEDGDELKECLLFVAHYIDERMNGAVEEDGDDGGEDEEIRRGKGRIRFLRCVEAMYGAKGQEMVEIVEAEPEKLLPIVRRRLHQKMGELERASQENEVYPMATR